MKIVGSYLGIHDQGVSLIEDNNILACYSDERFSRIKSCYREKIYPKLSLDALQKDFNIDIINDSNIILASAKPINTYLSEVVELIKKKPVKLYGHHYSHACGAYYTSGFDENTLIVSYDGGDFGDDEFTEINKDNLDKYFTHKLSECNINYTVKDGKLIRLNTDKLIHGSIATLWYVFCYMFGLIGLKDEGKIMGLAAQGKFDEKIFNQLKYFVDNDLYYSSWILLEYYQNLLKTLSIEEQWNLKRKLAYNLQYITEITLLDLMNNINKKHGPFKNLCVTGGIFANVKLNQKINEYLSFDNVWVYPAMSDEGLSLGSAIACGVEMNIFKNRRIDNVFFGKSFNDKEIEKNILSFPKTYNKNLYVQPLDYDVVGDLLVQGKVVGLYDGATEYGPRALGNRSIMVEPTKKETHEYINMRLKRDEIMPFAPIILEEKIEDICYYYKSKHTSEFMTMCYNVRDEWFEKIPAVINVHDGTARPQIVNRHRHKHFYNILTNFYEKTGIPVLMNTSFNGHGEPIINSPQEALDHLSKGTIDYLIINNKICNT